MDFTLKKYSELLDAIGRGDYRIMNNISKGSILRHDVDRSCSKALKMAKLEAGKKVKSTYYFRVPKTFDTEIINEIYKLGHEIGYHYEALDKAKGDNKKAIELFKKEWALFKRWKAKTICMHGNPLTKWDNRDLWKKYDFKKLGVQAEAYLSVDFEKINYFTDTGRKWNNEKASVKDKTNAKLIPVKNTDELIIKIKKKEVKRYYILTHPERWNDDMHLWMKELVWQKAKNVGKRMLK